MHSSLHRNCQHKITYRKINPLIKYPSERLVWDLKGPDASAVTNSISQIDVNCLFFSKSVHQEVHILNRMFFDDRDPAWMTSYLTDKFKCRKNIYTDYLNNGKTNAFYLKLQQVMKDVSEAISKGNNDYHNQLAQTLNDSDTFTKTYWSILKRFYNRKLIPVIPPLLIDNKLESDFEKKIISMIISPRSIFFHFK